MIEKLKSEPHKAFYAFKKFLNLKDLIKVSECTRIPLNNIAVWYETWHWNDRSKAFLSDLPQSKIELTNEVKEDQPDDLKNIGTSFKNILELIYQKLSEQGYEFNNPEFEKNIQVLTKISKAFMDFVKTKELLKSQQSPDPEKDFDWMFDEKLADPIVREKLFDFLEDISK